MGEKRTSARSLTGRIGWLLTLAASVAVVGGTAVGAIGQIAERSDPGDSGVQAIIDAEFTGPCVTAATAASDLSGMLEAEGYATWRVTSLARDDQCVAGGLDSRSETVFLFQVQSPNVTNTMHGVEADLMGRCLGKDQAVQYVSSVLTGIDVKEFSVRTDGPFSFPLDQENEVKEHVAAGCYVYSGSGHDADGIPTYYLSGNDG
jgi:hypothetical protein